MGRILIILGLIVIAASVALWIFYRKNPLKYTPPEVHGTAASYSSRTVRETESFIPEDEDATAPLIPEDEDATAPLFPEDEDATAPLIPRDEDATATLTKAEAAYETATDHGSVTVPLIQNYRKHD